MYVVVGLLTKREHLSREQFIDYYENHHVPLILRLAPAPLKYRRTYIRPEEEIPDGKGPVSFDVMTELTFEDAQAFDRWTSAIFAPGNAEQVIRDEEQFIDRPKTCAYAVDQRMTS